MAEKSWKEIVTGFSNDPINVAKTTLSQKFWKALPIVILPFGSIVSINAEVE